MEIKDLHWYVDEEVHTKSANVLLHTLIDDEIERQSFGKAVSIAEIPKRTLYCSPQDKDVFEAALRQVQKEPCWFCKHGKPITAHRYDSPLDDTVLPKSTYCPNCGRQLVKP